MMTMMIMMMMMTMKMMITTFEFLYFEGNLEEKYLRAIYESTLSNVLH